MNKNISHKNQLTNEEAEFIISKALRNGNDAHLSDEKFDELWNNVEILASKTKTMRLRFYSIAAAIALIVTITGKVFYDKSQSIMKTKYEQSTMALNKVSKYLNIGLSKIEPIEKYEKVKNQLELLEKQEKEVEKLKYIKKLPVIIE
jgi:predicted transcriptional regulator